MSTTIESIPDSPARVGDLDRSALDRLGIRFSFNPAVALEELDVPASRAVWNQARLGDPVDQEHVEELVAELERNVELPPIIFYRDDAGKAVVLSGNHRREAHQHV